MHHHNHKLTGKKLWLSIALNIALTLAQVYYAYASDSLSLMSDALHNFSDVTALILSVFALYFVRKKSTTKKTFGYKRIEIIAAFLNTLSLLLLAILLCKESVLRFVQPIEVHSVTVFSLGSLSIFVNLFCVLLLKTEAEHSLNLRSAYLHLFSDILSSIAIVLGALLMHWTQWFWIDSLLTLGVAGFLIYASWPMFVKILKIIMHFTPAGMDLRDIEKEILLSNKVANVHHAHLWQLNDNEIHLEAHIEFHEDLKLSEASKIIEELSATLCRKFGISHTVLQPEVDTKHSKQLIATECQH